jgi:hypothetical protein
MQYWFNGPSWPFKEACIPGKKAEIVCVVPHAIRVWSVANPQTRFNGMIRKAKAKPPEFFLHLQSFFFCSQIKPCLAVSKMNVCRTHLKWYTSKKAKSQTYT